MSKIKVGNNYTLNTFSMEIEKKRFVRNESKEIKSRSNIIHNDVIYDSHDVIVT